MPLVTWSSVLMKAELKLESTEKGYQEDQKNEELIL